MFCLQIEDMCETLNEWSGELMTKMDTEKIKKSQVKNTHGEDLKDFIVLPNPLFCIKMLQAKHS